MYALLGATFLVALLICVDSVPWIIRIARRRNFLDHPGPGKIHTTARPYGGGIAVALGMLLTLGCGIAAALLQDQRGWFDHLDFATHAAGVIAKAPTLAIYAAGSVAMLLLGLVDDRRSVSPRGKLLLQSMIAVATVLSGERLSLFWEGTLAGDCVGIAVTVLWIVGVTNAMNLLDHMDGLASGTGLLVSLAFAMVAWQTGQLFLAGALAALAGACAGFLFFNFPPSKIFLGDAGSYFIGYWLAVLTVSFTFYESGRPWYAYAVPFVVLAVPLFDVVRVVFIRIRHRRPVFRGDRNHFAHRLTDLGLSPRAAVLSIHALTAVTGLAAILLYQVNETGAAIVLAQLLLVFAVITLLEISGRKNVSSD